MISPCAISAYQPEKIFQGMEYDPYTKEIYPPCSFVPIGRVEKGKIVWNKKNKKALQKRKSNS